MRSNVICIFLFMGLAAAFPATGEIQTFNFKASSYFIPNEMLDWYQSGHACKAVGFELVSVETQEEDEFILSIIRPFNESFWTSGNDLYKEGEFYWESTGQLMGPYFNWVGPPNLGDGQRCVRYQLQYDLLWDNESCQYLSRIVCEKAS
ncbi:low affinity immunoglobulin epsilon Fc receptor-like [Neocloeon triangulifer]|uniref:low affinity immunoglobulin epsilon Fc receptor-like n=1 Tax=Neocloeon triangulifer TaxID=2078957 RepID=UPI00286F1493|nr:low affinity immunoglobulin epsilon Fc receptor-like [Neocloeon triangulifer]